MALDPELYNEFTELTKDRNATGGYVRNLLLFRLCKAVEALKVELVQVEMAKAEVMFNRTGNTDG